MYVFNLPCTFYMSHIPILLYLKHIYFLYMVVGSLRSNILSASLLLLCI